MSLDLFTEQTQKEILSALKLTNVLVRNIADDTEIDSWEGIRRIVRGGHGAEYFPVGHTFEVAHSVYGTKSWIVLGHDICENADNPGGHTMTICAVPILAAAQFDAPEAFYYAESELSAGTYNFTLPNTYTKWAAGTYQFTLTQALPAGGQLAISGYADAEMTARKVNAFASRTATSAQESVTITAGSEGTALGSFETDLNHPQRVSYGSSNYKESAVRQALNSEAAAGSVWTPQTKYDRPPSWKASMAGFLAGLDAELKEVLCTTKVKCGANNVFEAQDSTVKKGGTYTVDDKVFLLSNREVGFSADINDGSTLMPFYDGAANADRIKYNSSGSAAYWWLRTPNSGDAIGVRLVNTDGSMLTIYAPGAYGLAPACNIG